MKSLYHFKNRNESLKMTSKKRLPIIRLMLLAVLLMLLIPAKGYSQTVAYVNVNATGTKDGTSWANAYDDLTSALAASTNQIWVAAGTYKPGGAGSVRTSTFTIPTGKAIYGGFNGTESNLTDRNWRTNVTILSGDIGTVGTYTDNVYHVVSFSGVSSGTTLDGFTVTKGYADQTLDPNQSGGGIYNQNGWPTVANCIVEDNYAYRDGGGIMSYATAATTNITITSCVIRGNTAMTHNGGGVEIGGWGRESNGTVTNCLITGNKSASNGSGIEFANGYSPGSTTGSVINTTISGNSATASSSAGLSTQIQSGGTLLVTAKNCIIYDNSVEIYSFGTPITVSYSDVKGFSGITNVTDGGNNIDSNPLFTTPIAYSSAPTTAGDFTISVGSPCTDVGDDNANSESYDIRGPGYTRKLNKTTGAAGTIDMGAYEFVAPAIPAPTITSFTPTSAATGTTVTITGTNFTGATSVSFGGTAAASFIEVSATSITAVVAAGTTGTVSVTTPGGTVTSAGTFTFKPAYLTNLANPIEDSAAGNADTYWNGQAFRTGSNALNLSSVDLSISIGGAQAVVKIYSSNAGVMGTEISSLTGTNVSGNIWNFSPATPLTLSANTTYWLMLYSTILASTQNSTNYDFTSDETYTGIGTIPTTNRVAFSDDAGVSWEYFSASDPDPYFSLPYMFALYGDIVPTLVWTGSTSTDWNTASNWNPQTVPSTTDEVVIPNTTNKPISTNNIEIVELTLDAGATLTIAPTHALKVNGNIVNNGQIIFKSDATGSGVFDAFTGTLSGSGTATVERYIPAKRAFRFLSPSVTTATTINQNWQENGGSSAGLGTHITGSGGATNGFDATTTNNPSLFSFNPTTGTGVWEAITDTNTNILTAGTPYRLMVRGDRTVSLVTNTPTPTATTLRATGALKTGDSNPVLNQNANGYSFIGNPYQAPLDIKAALIASTNMDATVVYYWDPTLNARGGYVTRNLTANTNGVTSSFNEYLQPGQAVFVKKDNTATAPTMTIKESHKSVSNKSAGVFRVAALNTFGLLRVNLQANVNNQWETIEGTLAIFNDNYSWGASTEDANKLSNLDEEVSFVQDNTSLAIAMQTNPVTTDELPVKLINTRYTNYQWQFKLTDYDGLKPYLFDTQNNTYTQIDNNTIVPFTVNGQEPNRFKIVFQSAVLNTPDFDQEIALYPNPAKDGRTRFYIQGITNAEITLHNLLGQSIPVQLKATSNTLEVEPMVSLSKGVYLVRIIQDGHTELVKWIVE